MSRLLSLLDYLRGVTPRNTASLAKERLQIIVSHERTQRHGPDFLPLLQREIIDVIAKYIPIERDQVKIELARNGGCSVLELNIALPAQQPMEA